MSDRQFQQLTKEEVLEAQRAWAKAVIEQDLDGLLALYDFGTSDQPLLFKPTLADVIRLDEEGARSYFVGGNAKYPTAGGFLKHGWKKVDFKSAAGPLMNAGGLSFQDMGQYDFINGAGAITKADYTFAYHKVDGKVLISLHHSSLTWEPS
ncbi:MAG: hypothetical protein MK135_03695 [Polyangiaceae bacterium]|nr:hypothetical protein [Polyangiaceae bacterium]